MEKTQVCSKCNKEKPLTSDYFGKKNKDKDVFIARCKDCIAEYQKSYRDKNKEKIIQYRKQYREENREELIMGSKKYREENREELLQKQKEWYYNNKDRYVEWGKKYRKANKEEIAIKKKIYAEENKEIIAEYRSRYYQYNKDVLSVKQKQYYEDNKDEILIKQQQYYRDNREVMLKKGREYQKKNLHIYRQSEHRYRARKRLLPSTLTVKEWNKIKQTFNNSCAYCGMTEDKHLKENNQQLHQDHFVPLAEGGEYTHNNIIPSCRSCNCSKQDKNFSEWYKQYEHYDKKREQFILKYLGYTDNTQQLSIL